MESYRNINKYQQYDNYTNQQNGYFDGNYGEHTDPYHTKKSRSAEFLDQPDIQYKEPVYFATSPKMYPVSLTPTTLPKVAVQRITDKYDSLGKVKGNLCDGVRTMSLSDNSPDDDCNEVTDQDVLQVEAFFRSHKTYVFVCPALANLYYSSTSSVSNVSSWKLAFTGIPALLLDKGNTKARTERKIQIVLAEKGSGFLLWKDIIDHLSAYKAPNTTFHTMCLSSDHRKVIGLSFDNKMAAMEFYDQVETLTSDPANISLSGPKKKGHKNKKSKPEKVKAPKKADISQPCCFQHITKMDMTEGKQLLNMATFPDGRKHSV